MTPEDPAVPRPRRRLLWKVAVAFHLVVGAVPYLPSGLVAPWYGVAALWAIWVGFAVAVWRLRDRPKQALLVPPIALLTWALVVNAGDVLLGWTA